MWGFFFSFIGQIDLPPGGDKLILSAGSNGTIAWFTRDPDNVDYRSWSFTKSSGNKSRSVASSGAQGANVKYGNSGLDVRIQQPDTLVLINVNQSYDGLYRLNIISSVSGGHTSDVTVYITSKFR